MIEGRTSPADRVVRLLLKYSGWYIVGLLVITGLLIPPIFLLAPTEQASQEPGGPVFDIQETVHEKFAPRIHIASFIAEDRQGDILRQQPLWELYQNQERLRRSDLGPLLYSGYDADNRREVVGVFTIADAVNLLLAIDPGGASGLQDATDLEVKLAVHRLFSGPGGEQLRESLSMDASAEAETISGQRVEMWRAAALFFYVAADNALLGGGPPILGLSNDPTTLDKERFNRRVQEILRGNQEHYRLWGLAIDVNLASLEQGREVLPYIAAAIVLVLIVVGVTLRSWRYAVFAFAGLLMVLIWLKGGSNLVGLRSSLSLDLIVPIAVVALGVDFFIHATARYRDEQQRGLGPTPALAAGLAGVIAALTLAMLSDGIAFLANVTSGIESIIGFGVAAGIAVVAAYLIMGMFLPLAIMRWEQRRGIRTSTGPDQPTLVEQTLINPGSTGYGTAPGAEKLASLVVALARRRWLVLSAVAVLTSFTTYAAFQLEPNLDVKDFFDSESDLVVGLDKLAQHVDQDLSGEPGVIYIEGDLASPEALTAIEALLARMKQNPHLGTTEQGEVRLYQRTVLSLLEQMTGNEYAREQVEAQTGMGVTDTDGNGLPDGPRQIEAVYDYMHHFGVPRDQDNLLYDSQQVRETVFHEPGSGEEQATLLVFGVRGTREQANLAKARRSLEHDLIELKNSPAISAAGVTGSPFIRETTLHAVTKALNVSLPVAAATCLVLVAFWMRSIRLALAVVIPMGLVVSWLYAFMYAAGYQLNFVTATIAAVSIGLGIDYSIHVAQRYRQELRRAPDQMTALRATASGTGGALAGSAASSAIGFSVLAFAPMPLFSAYGIITATMIIMAAAAALVVLPSLLTLAAGPAGGPLKEEETGLQAG